MIIATIEKDGLQLPKSASCSQFLQDNVGKRVVIKLVKPTRSDQQHRYYFLYLGVIEKECGNTVDELHSFFKRKLLPPKFIEVMGEEIKIPGSTKDLTKAEFGDYLDRICALTNVPLPDIEAAGFVTNY